MTEGVAKTAELAALACRAAYDERAAELLRALPASDGPALLAYVRRHRVQGLVWDSLAAVPGMIDEMSRRALAEDARTISAGNLATASELGRLQDAFDSAGVDLLHVKGLTLGSLCYRRPMAKAGWDIDLLIAPEGLGPSAAILADLGYECRLPKGGRHLRRWHSRRIESVWIRAADGMAVELHTRLTPSPALIPTLGVASPRQPAMVGGRRLETLDDAPLLAYLAVHGATSLWFRLKWLSDFAALAFRLGDRLDAVAAEASGMDVGRCLTLAFRLGARFFDTPVPPACAQELGAADEWLLHAAIRQLAGPNALTEPTGERLGTLPIHVAGLLLGRTPAFAIRDAARRARDALLDRFA